MNALIIMFYALPVWMFEKLLAIISDLWGLGWDFYDCARYAQYIIWTVIVSIVLAILT